MLTKKSIEHTATAFKFSHFFSSSPFTWRNGKSDRKLAKTSSVAGKVIFYILASYLACEAMYHMYQIWIHYGETNIEQVRSYFKLIAHASTRFCGIVFAILAAMKAKDAAYLYNQLLVFNGRFQAYHLPGETADKCRRSFWVFKHFLRVHPIVVALTYAQENTDMRYWHGILLPKSVQPFLIPFFFMVELWISILDLINIGIIGFLIATYCSLVPTWMRILVQNQSKINSWEWKNNGAGDACFALYQSLRVLNNMYNNCFSSTLAWVLASMMVCLVTDLTMTIRIVPNLQFPLGVIPLLIALRFTIVPQADFTSASTEFTAKYCWACAGNNALTRRKRRSLRPLEAKCMGFFVIKRETLMEFWNMVTNNTVAVLLMT